MKLKPLIFALGLVLLGQGCLQKPVTAPATGSQPSPTGEPTPEGFVGFKAGFGKLPGRAPKSDLPAGSRPSVALGTELPAIPLDVTVLRQRKTTPNESLLQNITTAFQIPAGVLGRAPKSTALTLRWQDNQGYAWSYDAASNRLTFERSAEPEAATISALLDDGRLVQISKTFLDSRGITSRGWGQPEPSFSWFKWWERQLAENRCMDDKTLAAMRAYRQKDGKDGATAPPLPLRDTGARCLNPEFPTLQVVDYSATRDEQLVLDRHGETVLAARFVLNAKDGSAQSGWYELQPELDRSNYPALSGNEVLERLRAGGLNPLAGSAPGLTVTFDSFVLGLYRHEVTLDGQPRSYFIPALWARGTARRADGSVSGYATVVPLVRDEEFAGQ